MLRHLIKWQSLKAPSWTSFTKKSLQIDSGSWIENFCPFTFQQIMRSQIGIYSPPNACTLWLWLSTGSARSETGIARAYKKHSPLSGLVFNLRILRWLSLFMTPNWLMQVRYLQSDWVRLDLCSIKRWRSWHFQWATKLWSEGSC